MRLSPVHLSIVAALASTLYAVSAHADQMDPAIERLTKPFVYNIQQPDGSLKQFSQPCAVANPGAANPQPGGRFPGNITARIVSQCSPDNVAFAKLVSQYGMAIAPTAMHSARTTGYGSFHLSIEAAYTTIDKNADYWHQGTQGTQDPNTKKFSIDNSAPASMLQVYSLRIRKGFPFGFEIGAQVGYMAQTSLVTGGADVRWSLLEGFRHGALGILPDVAVGGGVRTLTGTPEFNLTIASFDVQISKPLPVADSSIITPYVGFQMLWIFGDSGLVDTTPNTDPLGYCNYSGANLPGNPDMAKKDASGKYIYDGQPVCGKSNGKAGSPLDFNNTLVFDNVRVQRQRLIIGMDYRYEVVFLGGQFMTEVVAPQDVGGRDNASKLTGMPKQTSFAFHAGALFLAPGDAFRPPRRRRPRATRSARVPTLHADFRGEQRQSNSGIALALPDINTMLSGAQRKNLFTTTTARLESVCELGHGGMGTVSLCQIVGPLGFSRLVVQKRMHPYLASDELTVKRFLLEAKIAAGLHHANIVGIQGIDRDAEGWFLLFDYVEGDSLQGLAERAARRGERLPVRVVNRILLDILAGLHAAHETTDDDGQPLDIVHRDVTPQNILVGRDGTARLADFGVARSSRMPLTGDAEALVGKVLFMSPEYLRREPTDRRLDVYSMGVSAWLALAGSRPWSSTSEGGIVMKIVTEGVPSLATVRPDLPAELVAVIDRACRQSPEERFATAQEMAHALEAAAGSRLVGSHAEVTDFLESALGGELSSRRRQTRPPAAPETGADAFVARVTGAASRDREARDSLRLRNGVKKVAAIAAVAAAIAFASASFHGFSRSAIAAERTSAAARPSPTASARVTTRVAARPAGSTAAADSRFSHWLTD